MEALRIRSGLRDAALVLFALVVLAGSVAVVRGYTLSGAPDVIAAQPVPALRVLAIVDDLAGDGQGGSSAIEQAASALSWDLTVLPARGVGFTAAPAGEPNLPGLVERSFPEGAYDAVIIQAGGPDAAAAPGAIGTAALGTIGRIRDRVPLSTRIVLIGPVRPAGEQADLVAVRSVLEAVATRERVFFLDPMSEPWLAEGADPTDPVQQRAVARRLAAEMRDLELSA